MLFLSLFFNEVHQMLFQHLQSTNQLQICNNQSKMNYYCLLRARCLEHQPVVALNLLFELLPLRLRVGRAA